MSERQGSQGAYERVYVCAQLCVWERHIKLNWRMHGPRSSRARDNPVIESRSSVMHMHMESVTGSISRSKETFLVVLQVSLLQQLLPLVLLLWVRSVSENNWATSTKYLWLIIASCHHNLSPYSLGENQKHFAFRTLKYGEQCREVNWHLFGLFVCLVTLPNSHQATRQQGSDFSYTSEVEQRYNTACQNDTQVSCNDYIVFTPSLYPSSKRQASTPL